MGGNPNLEATERKLATILAMDVVDYSAKMSRNEETTLQSLRQCREIIEKVVSSQKGRIFNTAGDAFMIEFASPVAAVTSAVNIQKEIKDRNSKLSAEEHLEFRMGVNMGDIMIEGENLFGEGVNVAARLEGIAPAGGVCISEIIHSVVKGKVAVEFIDQGPQELKNIDEPVTAYYADLEGASGRIKSKSLSTNSSFNNRWIIAGLAIFAVLVVGYFGGQAKRNTEMVEASTMSAVIVLPLENMGNDEIKSFSQGLSQDLANGLSRSAKSLNVIGLSETPANLDELVSSTGAKYVVKGSIRQAGDSIRLAISLVETEKMGTIWTENYDKTLSSGSIFELQDTIVGSVVDELVGNGAVLVRDVVKKLQTKGTDNLTALECVNYFRITFARIQTVEAFETAFSCLKDVVKDDPSYADGWVGLAQIMGLGYANYSAVSFEELNIALNAVDRALEIDPGFPLAHSTKAKILFYQKDWSGMFQSDEEAVNLAPNDSRIAAQLAANFLWGGSCTRTEILDINAPPGTYASGGCRWQTGVEEGERAHLLDKGNIDAFENYALAIHYIVKEEFEKVIKIMSMVPAPGFFWWDLYVGTAHDGLGNSRKAIERFDSIKVGAKNNKLEDIKKRFDFWNVLMTYYPTFEPYLIKYGFN